MASPEAVLPLDHNSKNHSPVSEPGKESPVANEQIHVAEDSTTAASSTGSTPAPNPTLELPLQTLDKAQESAAPSQKPPKITPRGVRRIKPLREKVGVYIQPWDFNFEAISKAKLSQDNKGKQEKKHLVPAAKKKVPTINRTNSASSTLATLKSLDSVEGTNSNEVESSPTTATSQQPPHRRQHGKLHTTRVEFLLKKYLQDPADVVVNGENQISVAGTAGIADERGLSATGAALASGSVAQTLPFPHLQKPEHNFQKRTTKSIMQVKGEQDAAVRALQHAPRQFRAKPIPLEVATPRLEKPIVVTATNSAATENIVLSTCKTSTVDISPRGSISAKSVPPSTTEPRYALLVADSVLRRYSAGNQANEENTTAEDSKAGNNLTGGLQKWLSWPAGQEDQGEGQVHQQTSSSPRPQSARPRRRSQSPGASHLPDIVEEAPEQLKEFY